MVIAGSPDEVAALEDFQAELARIMAGGPVEPPGTPADAPPEPEPPELELPEPEPPRTVSEPPRGRRTAVPYRLTIRQLPPTERPRERLREYGSRYLNNAELLAILLRTGVQGENAVDLGQRIIAEFEGLSGLARAEYAELCEQHGLGDAKTSEIIAALELGRRIASLAPEERAQISCPQDAANLVAAEMSLLAQENLVVLLLNTRNQVVARRTIYIGTVNSSAVRPAEVLRPAIRENAPSLIVIHNHPSGDPTPSPEDIKVTHDLFAAGKLMDIDLLDHLVIGSGGRFTSLKEKGLGFDRN